MFSHVVIRLVSIIVRITLQYEPVNYEIISIDDLGLSGAINSSISTDFSIENPRLCITIISLIRRINLQNEPVNYEIILIGYLATKHYQPKHIGE